MHCRCHLRSLPSCTAATWPRDHEGIDTHFTIAAALALTMLALTTALHQHALHFLALRSVGRRLPRVSVVAFLVALVGVHLVEIGLYAVAYAVGTGFLALGSLITAGPLQPIDYFYFAAQTYSTLGYGDIVPTAGLRLLASVESLNGLMLLSWSGAFLFGVMDDHGEPPPSQER